MSQKFSVLMSLYIKEKPEYVRECFESLLKQSAREAELVVVEEDPLIMELHDLLDEYKYLSLIKKVAFAENRRFGSTFRDGSLNCSHELIMCIDTDDNASEDRIEKQLVIRKQVYQPRYISRWDYVIMLIVQFIVCSIPNNLREIGFEKTLQWGRIVCLNSLCLNSKFGWISGRCAA